METEATTEKLGRFGHHPDPAIDFCVEVEEIEAITHNIEIGFDKLTDEFRERFARAFNFRVGGDENAIAAKDMLRGCEVRLVAAQSNRKAPTLTPLEEEMLAALERVRDWYKTESGRVLRMKRGQRLSDIQHAETINDIAAEERGECIAWECIWKILEPHYTALTKAESLKAQAAKADTVEG